MSSFLPEQPWRCHDCGEQQKVGAEIRGRKHYNSNGWYRVRLAPGQDPVMLDIGCFNGYDRDWPMYDGTWDTSPWTMDDAGLWVLDPEYWNVLRDSQCATCQHPAVGHGHLLGTGLLRCSQCSCTVAMATGARRAFLIREGESLDLATATTQPVAKPPANRDRYMIAQPIEHQAPKTIREFRAVLAGDDLVRFTTEIDDVPLHEIRDYLKGWQHIIHLRTVPEIGEALRTVGERPRTQLGDILPEWD